MIRGIRARGAAIAGLTGAMLLMMPGRPVTACTCVALPPAQQLAQADLVFRGTVEELETKASGTRAAFFVTWVYKGAPPRRVVVSTGAPNASCGLHFTRGSSYLVYAKDGAPGLSSDLCSGTTDDLFALDRAGMTGYDVERPVAAQVVTPEPRRAAPIAFATVLFALAFAAHARRFRLMERRRVAAAQPRA